MPPVPQTWTFRSSSIDSMARRNGLAELEAAVARSVAGTATTLTASGMTSHRPGARVGRTSATAARSGRGRRHLVDDGHVELVQDQPTGRCGRRVRRGRSPRAPAAAPSPRRRWRSARRSQWRTSGGSSKRERRGVIVVDQHDDVGLLVRRSNAWRTRSRRRAASSSPSPTCRGRSPRRSPARGWWRRPAVMRGHRLSAPLCRAMALGRATAREHHCAYSSCDMPVMSAAACWKLWPSVAKILARK